MINHGIKDHVNALKAFRKGLKHDGTLVIDYFNTQKIIKNLTHQEIKTIDGIEFHLHKFVSEGKIIKHINFEHRLKPSKLLNIIKLSEERLGIEDAEIEVEYQSDTIGKYGLAFDGTNFILMSKQTNCLASDKCGIPVEKLKVNLVDLQPATASACCTPGGGCC